MGRPIALLTDFGLRDHYVGVMKGAILSVNPDARIVDLTHEIDSQDIASAYFLLQNSYPYFPKRTIFVAVVDPGVGTERAVLGVETAKYLFLAPDNGLLGFLGRDEKIRRIVRMENAKYFRPSVSTTFHGRDVFAPVAAHLSRGVPLARMGPTIRAMQRIPVPTATSEAGGMTGSVVSIDRFGNLITNIPGDRILPGGTVRVGKAVIRDLAQTYGNRKPGQVLAYIGSSGALEIAVNGGHAARRLGVRVGGSVRVAR